MKKFLYELSKKILSSITRERNVQKILLISLLICIFFFISVNSFLLPDKYSSSTSSTLSEETEQRHLRNLESILNTSNNDSNISNFIENNNMTSNNETENMDTILIKIKPSKINITEKLLFYEFIKTISTGFYYGDWDSFQIKKSKFHKPYGEGYLAFYRKSDKNYLLNLGNVTNSSRIAAYLTLKDGKYIDDYLELNFTFTLEDIKLIDLKNESINIILYDVPISYSWEEYIDSGKLINLNHSFINLTFYKNSRQFQDYIEYKLTSNKFGNISLEIGNSTDIKYDQYKKIVNINNTNDTDNETMNDNITNITINNIENIENDSLDYEHNFEISFYGVAYGSKYYSSRTLDYSIFTSICCIIEIYLTSQFTKLVNTNDQMALNTDLYTILIHIMWTSLICGANFFMALTRTSSSYEYGMPSFCYFALFSIFLLRILFLAWKARNRDITNMRLFRKKLLKFYLFFYVFLFLSLISVKIWYTYFICTLILMGSTWIFQIIYSAKKGTKPPMSYLYILSASFSKISLCFYLKGYKRNIFGYRPNYAKVIIVSLVIGIEAFILIIQKFFGAKFIIPKKFRKQGYDYYRKVNEISEEEKEVECVICLDKLRNLLNLDDDEDINNKKGNIAYKFFMKNLEKIKKKRENRGDYMITPCHHLFHKKCLEHWLNVKNQCPYCRQQIPPLEEF